MTITKCRFIAGCTCGLSVLSITYSCSDSIRKPNVLFILADDLRADALGCYGNRIIQTTNIDRLAENGFRFSDCYVMGGHHGAISAPSRAMLLSGKNLFHVYDKLEGIETMPAHFASDGYVTFATGKWHNEKSAFVASFQQGKNIFFGGMADHFNVSVSDLGVDGKLTIPEKKGFSTDIFADAVIEFIRNYSPDKSNEPFFCYAAFTVPHDPYSPRPDFIGKYAPDSIPLPGNYMPLHPFVFDDLTVRDENLMPWPRPPDMVRMALSDYYGLISHLDERIGDIISLLKERRLYKNTIIVFAADNGLAIGSHGLLGKQNLYEHSTRVPLIIAGPGIPEAEASDALVYLFDIYPTLAELCSITKPGAIDGLSLAPVISGDSDGVRESLFTAYRNTVRAVRTREWKLIRYPERNYTQLFNLMEDPLELNNLASDPAHLKEYELLMRMLAEWQTASGDTVKLTAHTVLPLDYDHTRLERKPDSWQPAYTLKKYFTTEMN